MSEAIKQFMMRPNVASSMQRTYDECYLTCSTALYYESQKNESEALRSWRAALDQIYFHNAYHIPPGYRPKTETERALMESLREMERHCKERVDTLEALRRSRLDAGMGTGMRRIPDGDEESSSGRSSAERAERLSREKGTVPGVTYPDLARAKPPPLPQRPVIKVSHKSASEVPKAQTSSTSGSKSNGSSWEYSNSMPPPATPLPNSGKLNGSSWGVSSSMTAPPPTPPPMKKVSRSPSPEKRTGLLTTLRNGKDGKRTSRSPRAGAGARKESGPAAAKAATQAWGSLSRSWDGGSSMTVNSIRRDQESGNDGEDERGRGSKASGRGGSPEVTPARHAPMMKTEGSTTAESTAVRRRVQAGSESVLPPTLGAQGGSQTPRGRASDPPQHRDAQRSDANQEMKLPMRPRTSPEKDRTKSNGITRRPLANSSTPRANRSGQPTRPRGQSSSEDESRKRNHQNKQQLVLEDDDPATTDHTHVRPLSPSSRAWNERVSHLLRNLPRGVDEQAAKQILNEVVVKGDEVHWDDVAGLDVAKNALKEAVVYPFLRPDLFMGLREPARGMLLFGPPGTGKTMLARAVATESRSTFFSISASSLTSKYLGESEKLVRALFQLAKALAPSIIFVDEIDSLLSSRAGAGEHEATRRIKTEFLIQWSDLARAAAGREPVIADGKDGDGQGIGDASRVLVLAATNLPWAIDEAARRRFVRRQYIPLPEGPVRAKQLRTLLGHQKHCLTDGDIERLVQMTDGFSGSDITYLAKDAAMGPLRSLGEALLQMSQDDIRPISLRDFEASLSTIRPSVSRSGLKAYEDWAREFGERA